jgi:hypothetical protein
MDLHKAYALCINAGTIVGYPDKIVDKYRCEIYETLEEANNEKNKLNPISFRILEIYDKSKIDNTKFRIQITINPRN